MDDLFYSVSILIFCVIGYYFSWRYCVLEKWSIAILLLMVCGLALRIYTSSDFFLHSWDERYHALVAKNIILHPLTPTLYDNPLLPYDYKDWTANHIWLHKQPLHLWTMAASMWLFGVNEIALRIPSILLSTIGIWLCFFIGTYFVNKKVGYLAAFFFSINGLILELTAGRVATDHTDIFFLFFIALAICFSILFIKERKMIYNVFVGVSMGAAILCKWLPALIVVPIWLLIILDSGTLTTKQITFHLSVILGSCILIVIPWQLYIYNAFPVEANWEADLNYKHITEVLEERTGSFYYFIEKIRVNYGELIYLPLIWYLWGYVKNPRLKRMAILVWIFIPLLFFSLAKTKMQAYIMFISPALFIVTADFFFMLNEYKMSHKFKWLFNAILFLLIAAPVRYMIERVKPFAQQNRNPVWATDLRELNNRNISKGVLFNYERPVEAMFYTNLTVYKNIPDKIKITELISNGYTVIVNDDGKLADDINTIKGLKIETFSTR
jgi:4-amino-4-deoxy-L-arabinose transferase-like glycosyltransferase